MPQKHHPWLSLWSSLGVAILLSLGFDLTPNRAEAQIYSGSVSTSTGGAGRASVEAGEAVFLNPATLVHVRGRHFTSSFSQDEWALGFSEHVKGAPMPAALGFISRRSRDSRGEILSEEKDLRFSLAEFIRPGFSFGLTAHQYEFFDSKKNWRQLNLEAGFSYVPRPDLGLALVFYDPVPAPQEIPVQARLNSKVGLALHWNYRPVFRIRADMVSGPNQTLKNGQAGLGFESDFNPWVTLRWGLSQDRLLGRESLSAGLGLDLARFRVDYASDSTLKGPGESRHSIDLGIPF